MTKRFLTGYKSGNLSNHKAHWSVHQCNEVSAFLERVKLPSEVDRPVRGLSELAHWKGIEYQSYLLYISIVVVNKFFSDPKIFNHFLLYYCAIVICSRNDQPPRNLDIAHSMLIDFLINFKALYGIDHFSSNLHNLCHLVDDVRKFGPLHTISAYPFESKLYTIKKLVRNGRLPLPQVANRICEFQEAGILNSVMRKQSTSIEFRKEMKIFDSNDSPLIFFLNSHKSVIYSEVVFPSYKLSSVEDKNRWFLSRSFEVVCIKYIIKTSVNTANVFLYGSPLKVQSNYFEYPLRSSELNIYKSDCELNDPSFFTESEIYCKMVRINFDHKTSVFIPFYPTIKKNI